MILDIAAWETCIRNGTADEIEVVLGTEATFAQAVRRAVDSFLRGRGRASAGFSEECEVLLIHTSFMPSIDTITYRFYVKEML